ncbi:hypothetical protein MLD38_012713 [Melastoma candidum]|uniref:Uncharacterized protein n=1 Tax=Melastoma candidum TaxID=119954 RepID=A0ACB9R917_9MYRT|nr:hypothetical protein MLD38_012713 [Melastoma candidum]
MIIAGFGESEVLERWVSGNSRTWEGSGMRNNDGQRQSFSNGGGGGTSPMPRSAGRTNGLIPSSFRAISSYWRVVSSGASTVARSAANVASSIVDKEEVPSHDQVLWAGFDKLEGDGHVIRRVLLLGYRSGFQVWDVEEADDVHDLVSRHDGPASFMQMLPNPIPSNKMEDKFSDSRPLLVVCGENTGGTNSQDGFSTHYNGSMPNGHDNGFVPTTVRFYSIRSQSYVHVLKFRSAIYSVRCSCRVVAISQAAQIHCFDSKTLERSYTILTHPITSGLPGAVGVGYGPLAVGPRWVAYSGSPASASTTGRVTPQHLTSSASFSSNGSIVAHYAMESSKQLAAGIVTLGDMGYKKLSRYYSELIPDGATVHTGYSARKGAGMVNGHVHDADNVGVVVVRDIVSKSVVAQFKAHKSPISALCFDPSGTLLVTASVMGHNINVFKIMAVNPNDSGAADLSSSCVHLFRLQRGLTNAVIQDISFSDDCSWIMVSSTRGTSHLFSLNTLEGSAVSLSSEGSLSAQASGTGAPVKSAAHYALNLDIGLPTQLSLSSIGNPVTLSAVSRIRSGTNGWRGTVSGAAAAATGRLNSLGGAIASSFHNCKCSNALLDRSSDKAKHHLLVFSPSGSMIQYSLQMPTGLESVPFVTGVGDGYDSTGDCDGRLVVEAVQKWNICQKHYRRDREDALDIYGENGTVDIMKIYPEGVIMGHNNLSGDMEAETKMRTNSEDNRPLYISEVELWMHQAKLPLWAKSGIHFQSMMIDDVNKSDEESSFGGEREIERISTRTVEGRSKDLVPVFDHLPTFKQQTPRVPNKNISGYGQAPHQISLMSEEGLSRSFRNGLDLESDVGSPLKATETCQSAKSFNGPFMYSEDNDSVNGNDNMFVNTTANTLSNRESSYSEEAPLMNMNGEDVLKKESHSNEEREEII